MDGSIYDFGLTRSSFALDDPSPARALDQAPGVSRARRTAPHRRVVERVGLIANPRSHLNGGQLSPWTGLPNVIGYAPTTRRELYDVLSLFASREIDVLAIDGGDGTVRDVLTCAGSLWGRAWPDILLLPTGKTNALAGDLGVPAWTLGEGLAAAGNGQAVERRPLEITAAEGRGPTVRGFIFGAGAFVDATALAQRTHHAGAFNGVAVGLALTWAIAQTLFGGRHSKWRAGSAMDIAYGGHVRRMHGGRPDGVDDRYLFVASTLQRMPLELKPFGAVRPGLKTLVVDAPPPRLAMTVGPLLAGSEAAWLARNGCHRIDADSVAIDIASGFILDGETFPAGSYIIREAAPLNFITA
jgi:diacylglycerol kinase (ATP)